MSNLPASPVSLNSTPKYTDCTDQCSTAENTKLWRVEKSAVPSATQGIIGAGLSQPSRTDHLGSSSLLPLESVVAQTKLSEDNPTARISSPLLNPQQNREIKCKLTVPLNENTSKLLNIQLDFPNPNTGEIKTSQLNFSLNSYKQYVKDDFLFKTDSNGAPIKEIEVTVYILEEGTFKVKTAKKHVSSENTKNRAGKLSSANEKTLASWDKLNPGLKTGFEEMAAARLLQSVARGKAQRNQAQAVKDAASPQHPDTHQQAAVKLQALARGFIARQENSKVEAAATVNLKSDKSLQEALQPEALQPEALQPETSISTFVAKSASDIITVSRLTPRVAAQGPLMPREAIETGNSSNAGHGSNQPEVLTSHLTGLHLTGLHLAPSTFSVMNPSSPQTAHDPAAVLTLELAENTERQFRDSDERAIVLSGSGNESTEIGSTSEESASSIYDAFKQRLCAEFPKLNLDGIDGMVGRNDVFPPTRLFESGLMGAGAAEKISKIFREYALQSHPDKSQKQSQPEQTTVDFISITQLRDYLNTAIKTNKTAYDAHVQNSGATTIQSAFRGHRARIQAASASSPAYDPASSPRRRDADQQRPTEERVIKVTIDQELDGIIKWVDESLLYNSKIYYMTTNDQDEQTIAPGIDVGGPTRQAFSNAFDQVKSMSIWTSPGKEKSDPLCFDEYPISDPEKQKKFKEFGKFSAISLFFDRTITIKNQLKFNRPLGGSIAKSISTFASAHEDYMAGKNPTTFIAALYQNIVAGDQAEAINTNQYTNFNDELITLARMLSPNESPNAGISTFEDAKTALSIFEEDNPLEQIKQSIGSYIAFANGFFTTINNLKADTRENYYNLEDSENVTKIATDLSNLFTGKSLKDALGFHEHRGLTSATRRDFLARSTSYLARSTSYLARSTSLRSKPSKEDERAVEELAALDERFKITDSDHPDSTKKVLKKHLIKFFKEHDIEKSQEFTNFVTGLKSAPENKITLEIKSNLSKGSYFVSHSCFMTLDVPEYLLRENKYQEFKKCLLDSMKQSGNTFQLDDGGFGVQPNAASAQGTNADFERTFGINMDDQVSNM